MLTSQWGLVSVKFRHTGNVSVLGNSTLWWTGTEMECMYERKWKWRGVQLFATLWTVAYQAPLSMGFSRQEHWSWLPFPSPGDLPDPGIKHRSSALWADALPSEPPGSLMHVYWKESEVTQSCLTLCNPMDCSLPGSVFHGIFQVRILECIAISFSTGSSQPRDRTWVSHTTGRLFTDWATREAQVSWSPS